MVQPVPRTQCVAGRGRKQHRSPRPGLPECWWPRRERQRFQPSTPDKKNLKAGAPECWELRRSISAGRKAAAYTADGLKPQIPAVSKELTRVLGAEVLHERGGKAGGQAAARLLPQALGHLCNIKSTKNQVDQRNKRYGTSGCCLHAVIHPGLPLQARKQHRGAANRLHAAQCNHRPLQLACVGFRGVAARQPHQRQHSVLSRHCGHNRHSRGSSGYRGEAPDQGLVLETHGKHGRVGRWAPSNMNEQLHHEHNRSAAQ